MTYNNTIFVVEEGRKTCDKKKLLSMLYFFKGAIYIFTQSLLTGWRCPWCNGYRRRKWTRQHEFKSWTRLIAFHIALIPLGKV